MTPTLMSAQTVKGQNVAVLTKIGHDSYWKGKPVLAEETVAVLTKIGHDSYAHKMREAGFEKGVAVLTKIGHDSYMYI